MTYTSYFHLFPSLSSYGTTGTSLVIMGMGVRMKNIAMTVIIMIMMRRRRKAPLALSSFTGWVGDGASSCNSCSGEAFKYIYEIQSNIGIMN